MTPEEVLALAHNFQVDGFVWRTADNYAVFEHTTSQTIKLNAYIVTKNWEEHKVGDVYFYLTGAGVLAARMGNVPDAMQFVYNKTLFEGF